MRKFAIFFLLVITACSTTAPESVSPEMTVTPVDTPTPGVTPDIAATAVAMIATPAVASGEGRIVSLSAGEVVSLMPESADFVPIAEVPVRGDDEQKMGTLYLGAERNGALGLAVEMPDGSQQWLQEGQVSMSERELFGSGTGADRYSVFFAKEEVGGKEAYRPVVAIARSKGGKVYFCPPGGETCFAVNITSDGMDSPGELNTMFARANERVKALMKDQGDWKYQYSAERELQVVSADGETVHGVIDGQGQYWSSRFDAIQQRVAEESEWTLESNGTLSRTSDEGLVTVTGLAIDRESGKCTYTGGDETIECDADSLVFGADGSITLTLADGTVVTTKDGESWKPVVEYVDINAMTADPYNFTPEQMTGFEKIGKTTITLNGHDVPALVGVSGEEQTVLAMEVTNFNGERVMARVSVTTDPETGVQYGVFVNPDFDAGDTEGQGDNTGRVMMALGEDGAQEIFFGKYGVFSRFGPAAPNGGKYGPIGPLGLRQLVAKSLGVGIEMDTLTQLDDAEGVESTAIMEWETLPRKVDWGLPLELVFVANEGEYDELPEEVKREIVSERDHLNVIGSLFWVGDDGHPMMFVMNIQLSSWIRGASDSTREVEVIRTQTGNMIFRGLSVLGRERDETRSGYAWNDANSGVSSRELKPLSEEAFEFNIK